MIFQKRFLELFRLAALGLLLTLAGCITLPSHVATELDDAKPGELNTYAAHAAAPMLPVRASLADYGTAHGTARGKVPAENTLSSGQILVRDDGDAVSLFVSLFAEEFMPWTHVGIISVEADGVYVYDTNGGLYPVPGLPPTSTYIGGPQRTPFDQYVSSARVIGIFAPPPEADNSKIAAFAREHFGRGTPFDAYFDNTDDSALYCSELVARALQAAGAAPIRPAPTRANRSYDVIRNWLRLRAAGFFLPGHFVDPTRQIALWSRELSLPQIEALFQARHELARRFTAEARLGHLFRWTGLTLTLREGPQRFMDSSLAAFAPGTSPQSDTGTVRHEIRRLADRHFSTPAGDR